MMVEFVKQVHLQKEGGAGWRVRQAQDTEWRWNWNDRVDMGEEMRFIRERHTGSCGCGYKSAERKEEGEIAHGALRQREATMIDRRVVSATRIALCASRSIGRPFTILLIE